MAEDVSILNEFEKRVLAEARKIHSIFNQDETVHDYEVHIIIKGGASASKSSIEFRAEMNYGSTVRGNHLYNTIYEAMRRNGWKNQNEKFLLSFNAVSDVEDEQEVSTTSQVPFSD